VDQPVACMILVTVDPAERPPQDTNTGQSFFPYRTGLNTFSHKSVLNVFNVGHPAETLIVRRLIQGYLGTGRPLSPYRLSFIQ
jgi:hypothetical protein